MFVATKNYDMIKEFLIGPVVGKSCKGVVTRSWLLFVTGPLTL